jgi:regulator of protease activity HflC (stomatin/prohibitin superfamily)
VVVLALVVFFKTIRIVPQKQAFIVERLGKYRGTLEAGFHILMPFLDKVSYKHSTKEQAVDVPPQTCITKDNVGVEVDGILYMQVIDPAKASYGINDYRFAASQLAQTTMRSVIGKLDLDKTFEERETMNNAIVDAVDKASDPWGVKVTRYEVKNIVPPESIREAMEKQMRAEREKRAMIAESEGQKQAAINRAEGDRQEMINRSEGEKQKRINEAEGQAAQIQLVAEATALGIRSVAQAIIGSGGREAVNLRIAEQYLTEFGKLAKSNNTMIIPANLADVGSILALAAKILKTNAGTEEEFVIDTAK